jgi:hypothetical protein
MWRDAHPDRCPQIGAALQQRRISGTTGSTWAARAHAGRVAAKREGLQMKILPPVSISAPALLDGRRDALAAYLASALIISYRRPAFDRKENVGRAQKT